MKMKMLLVVCVFFITIFLISSSFVFAVGPASVYKVTITKMELHNGTEWVTVFDGSSTTIDIAAGSSGAAAGNFLSEISVPDGTYTMVRTTVSRTFTIKGNDGGAPIRYTLSTTNMNGCDASVDSADEAECTIMVPMAIPPDTTTFSTPISVTNGVFSHKIRVSFNVSTAIDTYNGAGIYPRTPDDVTVTAIAL